MAGEINFGLLDPNAPGKIATSFIQGNQLGQQMRSQELQNQVAEAQYQNMLAKQDAYKAAGGDMNKLAQELTNRGMGEEALKLRKDIREEKKLGIEMDLKNAELHRSRLNELAGDPSDANLIKYYQNGVASGQFTPEQAQQSWSQMQGKSLEQRQQILLPQAMTMDKYASYLNDQQKQRQGTVPAGYRMTGQGTLEAIPGGPTTTPLAPKELQKRNADFPAAKAAIEGYESKADKFVDDLKALRDHPGLDSITGIAAGRMPGITGEGRAAQALYDKIVAKGGFQALQDLRAASKTGGALGNVSNQEGKQLVQSFAAIDRKQNAEDVRAALEQAIADVEGSKTRMREAYDSTYEYKLGGGSPAATTAPAGGSAAASAYNQWKQQRGR